nr:heme-binding protein [Streptomyces sp. SID7805]
MPSRNPGTGRRGDVQVRPAVTDRLSRSFSGAPPDHNRSPSVTIIPILSADAARRVLDAALAKAAQLNVAVAVAVVDSGGNLQTLARMDTATFWSTTIATHKAVTAAGLGVPTVAFGKFAAQDPILLATMATQPGSALLPGGIPIVVDGAIAGAIGVAGGTKGEDEPIAETGVTAAAG